MSGKLKKVESCSNRNIIKYSISEETAYRNVYNFHGIGYIVKEENLKTFDTNLFQLIAAEFPQHS